MSLTRLFVSLLFVCLQKSGLGAPIGDLPLQSDGHHLDARRGIELSTADPDRIVYPEDVTRDSYGNPVTPFHGLLEHNVDIGHMTDINKLPIPQDNRASTAEKGFVIPSYASGITKVETLFPNAPEFPLVAPTKGSSPSVDNNEPLPETKPITIHNFIVPPYRDDEKKVIYPTLEVNTQATLLFVDNKFVTPPPNGQSAQGPTIPGAAQPIDISHQVIDTHIPDRNKNSGSGDIYRGSFGGSAGILGDPQPLGWTYTQRGNPQAPVNQRHPMTQQGHGTVLDFNLLPPPSSNEQVSLCSAIKSFDTNLTYTHLNTIQIVPASDFAHQRVSELSSVQWIYI